MASLTRRIPGRPLALCLLLAAVLGFGLLGSYRHVQPAKAQTVDRIAVVLRWWDAEQRGDLDTALAQFAPNAVFLGNRPTGNCSYATPCTDTASIRQQIQGNVANHGCYTIRSIQVSGAVVTGVRENRTDLTRANGVERVLQSFMVLVPQDQITLWVPALDVADPDTAMFTAVNAGTQPAGTPMPAPTTPCPPLL